MNSKPKTVPQPKKPIPLPEEESEPLSDDEVIHDDVVLALARGDASTAAKALRKLDGLNRAVTELAALRVEWRGQDGNGKAEQC